MSTVQRINVEIISNLTRIEMRDFPLVDPTLANPANAVALVDGEWVSLDSTGAKIARSTDIATPGAQAALTGMHFLAWSEKGRTDVQAQAERKLTCLYHGFYTLDTRIFDAVYAGNGGAAITTVGQWLKIATITVNLSAGGSRNFTGLVGHGGAGDTTSQVVARVEKLPANNGGKLRIVRAGILF
jgi:hypothetical protein